MIHPYYTQASAAFHAGVAAADPAEAVRRSLPEFDMPPTVIAVGKAALSMAGMARSLLGPLPALVVGNEYAVGKGQVIRNDKPIIGHYNVNNEGSSDMYNKGAFMLHTLRQLIGNDEKWRNILRGLNTTFYHQTVTTKEIEEYLSKTSQINLTAFFNQYLRDVRKVSF